MRKLMVAGMMLTAFGAGTEALAWVVRSAEFLGKPDKKPSGPSDIAKSNRVLIPDDLADELRAV